MVESAFIISDSLFVRSLGLDALGSRGLIVIA